MKTCYFCQGKLLCKKITHVHTWGDKIFLFKDVPAEVCKQCGETYFRPDVLERMDEVATSDMMPKATVSVPVFSLLDKTD